MTYSVSEVANLISRALISSSKRSGPTRTWTPSMEQTLHRLGCRESLTPSLVALVIDPFLLNHQPLALGFFNWASQQPGFSHSSITYRAIFKSLSISRHFNAVDKLLKQVRAEKIHLDSSVYRSIIESQIKGHFHAASGLLCGLTSGIGDSDSHVVLLKCLIGAKEIPLSIEHIKWVRENSAVMLKTICTELLALDSPLSKSESTLQLVQAVQDNI